ncbi:NAD(P)/FAD-dependent oxidoreductase [Microbispora sp. RL4-1S]|uniref:NAD(P)/FAD-dependent oxidoreductase n=1 Tax=Microbispora oryzae TaxID=2806554 RepID=A0A940WN07_9ACTN|nr:NAD(P)/FAD-dependent oxidoreductase [Microbispora oryzae]MBP2708451.1 NAD(P)/FAD-dependent oxidoreductase [Microbispora oryzae]
METPHGATGPHRVVVIGSGFGGLFATKALRRAPVQVTLIDRNSYHLFQPLLYQVATGILSQGEIAPPIREILRAQRNVQVLLGEVTSIDLGARTVTSQVLGTTTVTPYDSLIVAAGSGQSYFGNDRFAEFAPGMKSVEDALRLRSLIFAAYEMAELEPDDRARAPWLSFVVVGGGPTGVEMAGQLAELSRHSLKNNFRRFDPADAKVVLVEATGGVLTGYGPRLSGRARRDLERLGVEVRVDAPVVGVDADGVDVMGPDGVRGRITAKTKIWAAGVSVSPLGDLLARASGAERNRAGQLAVLPDCTLPGHPEVFVVGDMMRLGEVSGLAQVAIQSGEFAAAKIRARLAGKPGPAAYRYRDKGMLATIARFRAIAAIGPLRLSGFSAWVLWLAVHLFYLVGFKNRVTVVLHWAVTFLTNGRSERTSTAPGAARPPSWKDPDTAAGETRFRA